MDVFRLMPGAIETGVWELGRACKGTISGDTYEPLCYLDVIVDEVGSGSQNRSPNADIVSADTLLYCRPEQLPQAIPMGLIGDYLIRNSQTGQHYEIDSVGVGKDQETGKIAHYELTIIPTEVSNG